jgi:hypothetical protein
VVGEVGSENGHLMVLGLDVKDRRTPPSYKGHEEVVKLLLNNGADSFGHGLRTTLGTDGVFGGVALSRRSSIWVSE